MTVLEISQQRARCARDALRKVVVMRQAMTEQAGANERLKPLDVSALLRPERAHREHGDVRRGAGAPHTPSPKRKSLRNRQAPNGRQ